MSKEARSVTDELVAQTPATDQTTKESRPTTKKSAVVLAPTSRGRMIACYLLAVVALLVGVSAASAVAVLAVIL